MRQVIEGKVYNTETATLLHEWQNGREYGDFRYRSKALYRTPKGAYFLLHDGGAMTDMARATGENSWTGSSRIEVVSLRDALRFLESHNGTEVLIREFADQIEEG